LTAAKPKIAERLSELLSRIDAAGSEAGNANGSIKLIAVSKNQRTEAIRAAFEAGQFEFGENYAQELIAKQQELTELPTISWHFIGHLQANKAKSVVGRCKLIQSVDSERIAGKIAGIATSLEIVQDVLIGVNIGGDITKSGVPLHSALGLCERVTEMSGVRLLGLMAIAPTESRGSSDSVRRSFATLRLLYEQLPMENRHVLSMGMSGDFEEAIAEGSTMVRIGTALFGERHYVNNKPI